MAYLVAGYAAFFLLLFGYLGRLALLGRRLARERARFAGGWQSAQERVWTDHSERLARERARLAGGGSGTRSGPD